MRSGRPFGQAQILRAQIIGWTKMDLINELAAIHGYRSYLEICTPTTGTLYGDLDRGRYSLSHRLMYRWRDQFDDGMAIDFRSSSLDSGEGASAIRASGNTYDVILVDPFHEYEASAQDLREACKLIKPTGTIVVHDCNPEEEALVTPAVPGRILVRPDLQGLSRHDAGIGATSVLHGGYRSWLRHHPPPASHVAPAPYRLSSAWADRRRQQERPSS